jgi:hypothetical protein
LALKFFVFVYKLLNTKNQFFIIFHLFYLFDKYIIKAFGDNTKVITQFFEISL